jgi:hypothetical protein
MTHLPNGRDYVLLYCGNCYRMPPCTDGVRYYSCVRCGEASLECLVCLRIARERDLGACLTCALCSITEEMGPEAS